jgi:hypothetical protein
MLTHMETLPTLRDFLAANNMCRATFYRLPVKPRIVRVGKRIMIRPADAEAWRQRLEEEPTAG